MRLIDADKLYPDCMTKNGTLAISQSQIANAPTIIWCNQTSNGLPLFDLRERPRGKWITVKQDTILGTFEVKNKVCDQCNHATKYEYPFCPNCGAKMWKGGAE